MVRIGLAWFAVALVACGHSHGAMPGADAQGMAADASGMAADAMTPSDARDAGGMATGDARDAGGMATGDAMDAGGLDAGGLDAGGVITGGPCLSGAPGAAAYRIRWIDGDGTAEVQYEVDGLPDTSRDHAAAYGYQIGFTPAFVDTFGGGGVQLDDSDFIDLELSTAGLATITQATLAIYGRSLNTSGSFNWQTFVGTGSTAIGAVSTVAPYQWYSADMTTEITAGDPMVLIRIKAGPSSDSLAVNRIELCLVAS